MQTDDLLDGQKDNVVIGGETWHSQGGSLSCVRQSAHRVVILREG
jgi:hypothetical protein